MIIVETPGVSETELQALESALRLGGPAALDEAIEALELLQSADERTPFRMFTFHQVRRIVMERYIRGVMIEGAKGYV